MTRERSTAALGVFRAPTMSITSSYHHHHQETVMALSQAKRTKLRHAARLHTLHNLVPTYPRMLDANMEQGARDYLATGRIQGYMVRYLAGRTDVSS